MSVPEIVRELITRNRSIYDCMKMDLINYTALAVKVHPEIERIQGSRVNLNTVVVAIKRYADSFEKEEIRDEPVLKNARLALTDGIMDVRFSAKDSGMMDSMAVLDEFSKVTDNYEFFRLSDSFRFLVEDMEDVRRIFRNVHGGEKMFNTGLAKIRISMPAQNQSDVVSYVAEVLHANGIELVNAFFGQDSITVILDERDSSRAYDILHSDIVRT
ncbi:MAG: ACT domain-containing protein [Nitrosopumilus sp. H8]|nr:MAG: ACT domain-containing protein [Nitrosopumilus sp. H13]RNJ79868.1 MAG: ACT domain-containing protein [Nitrosopumilus sp. H8]